jgi:hypothetical protein
MLERYNLDVSTPDDVPVILETVANHYRESAAELASAWTDPTAGKIWEDFARILDRAAESCRKAMRNRLLMLV